jgi:septal ring factor EnvC (AmiA/AmiB activator)
VKGFVSRTLIVAVAGLALFPAVGRAQDAAARLRAQRDSLNHIRAERESLEQQARELNTRAHTQSEELANVNQRAEATQRIVAMLDAQLATISVEVNEAAARVATAEQELGSRRVALQTRLVEIYKRGPMYTTQALLSARSFGDLVARYKYLHLLALHDRALVTRVQQLRDSVALDHQRLAVLQSDLEQSRSDKAEEEENLRSLQRENAGNLAKTKEEQRRTASRIARLRRTETQVSNTIAALEAERLRAERARPSAKKAASSISTSDYGKLAWPVQGPLLYTFGKAQGAGNSTIRWNGVGIKAAVGTAVKSVAAGRVVSVRQLGTYGLTIIVDHGGGDYSIYGSLSRADVKEQERVTKGQVIGFVGISDPDLAPHLHFEIRHGGPAVDPAQWLRDQP